MFELEPLNKNQMSRRNGSDLVDFYNMFDNFFNEDFFGRRGMNPSLRNASFKIDVKNEDKAYVIEAEMPGVKKEEVKLDYEESQLIIGVDKQEEIKKDQSNYIHRERRNTSMKRGIYLKDIDVQKIEAKLEEGILKIVAPKLENIDSKFKIEIK